VPRSDESWREHANCRRSGVDFYPADRTGVLAAKRLCRSCPVRIPCLEHALEQGEKLGVWGGLSEDERKRLWRD